MRKGGANMWCPGLIVIALANVTAAFELQCLDKYYSGGFTVVYIGEGGEKLEAFHTLMAAGALPWAIVNGRTGLANLSIDPGNYIIFACGDEPILQLRHIVRNLSAVERNWRPSARTFVLLKVSNQMESYELASHLIDILWGYSVFNAVIIFESWNQTKEYQVYSASPFDESNECGMVVKLLRKVTCDNATTIGLDAYMLWPYPEDYSNCSLNVSRRDSPPFAFQVLDEWRGADIKFVNLLSNKKRLHIIWNERPSPETTASISATHQYYQQFSRDGLDLAVGASIMRSRYLNKVHYLRNDRPYAQHGLIHYVADPDYVDEWKTVGTLFSTSVWWWLGVSMVTAGFCYNLLLKTNSNFRHSEILIFLAILLTQPIKQPNRWRHRLFVGVFLLGYYQISSLGIANLQSYVLHPPREKWILTGKDLQENNLTVVMSNTTHHQIRSSLAHNQVEFSTTPLNQRLILLEKYKNYSVLARSLEIDFWRNLYHYKIHPIEPGLTILSVSMAMGKGNQYVEIVEGLLQQCLESGLFEKWIRDLTTVLSNKVKKIAISGRKSQPLDGLTFAFFMLLAGCLISSIVFIGELFHRSSDANERQRRNGRNPSRKNFKEHVFSS